MDELEEISESDESDPETPSDLEIDSATSDKDETIVGDAWIHSIKVACEQFINDVNRTDQGPAVAPKLDALASHDLNFVDHVIRDNVLSKIRKLNRAIEDRLPQAGGSDRLSFRAFNSSADETLFKDLTLTNLLSYDDPSNSPSASRSNSHASLPPPVHTEGGEAEDVVLLKQQIQMLEKLNKKLRNENQTLQSENAFSTEKSDSNLSTMEAMRNRYLEMKKQHDNSLILIRALQNFKINLEQKNEELQNEIGELRSRAGECSDTEDGYSPPIKNDPTQLDKLRDENRMLQEKITKLQSGIISANGQVNEAKEKICLLEKEKQVLSDQLDFVQQERRFRQSTIDQSRTDSFDEPVTPTPQVETSSDKNNVSPWYTMSTYAEYNFFNEEIGDLEYTKALVRPVLRQAPISVHKAENLISKGAEELHALLLNDLCICLDEIENAKLNQRQWNKLIHQIHIEAPWSEALLKDLSGVLFLNDSHIEKKKIVYHIEKALRNQQAIVVPKVMEAIRMHFGDTITSDRVENFTRDMLATVQEHEMEKISVRIPRTITPSEQSKLLKLACVFDDSMELSMLLTSNSQDATLRTFMKDVDSHNCVQCGIAFTFSRRRHHCRFCGILVCSKCSGKRSTIPKFGRPNVAVRVCDRCFLVLKVMDDQNAGTSRNYRSVH